MCETVLSGMGGWWDLWMRDILASTSYEATQKEEPEGDGVIMGGGGTIHSCAEDFDPRETISPMEMRVHAVGNGLNRPYAVYRPRITPSENKFWAISGTT